MTCETCYFFDAEGSLCKRYPQHLIIQLPHSCGEHRDQLPSEEVLQTEIRILQTSEHTRTTCRRLGLNTVQDLIDFGRSFILTNNRPDRQAINELAEALRKHGVRW